ncbi:MAG: SDR family NAD(P)-dependent oxidoreductase [Chloroflexi bacterium]|nr:SDR family NAD(P)-dependent oxidoreductase [Chloroflexota bacterium]
MDLGLKGKVTVVTGSGRGIGRSIAMTLASEGAKVAVNDYYLDRAESVAKEIKEAGGESMPAQADITDAAQVEQMVKKILDKWGKVDILVNNAGIPAGVLETDALSLMHTFMESNKTEWERLIGLDLYGVLNCCHAVLGPMSSQNYGKIVSIISDAGRIGEPRQAVYSGVKAGIVGFSKALAKEVARYKINVNCVAPSATGGTYLSQLTGSDQPRTDEEKERLRKVMAVYPLARSMGRLGFPSDIANAVVFLSSDVSEWVTGQVLSVNGGYCMVD